VDHHHVAPRARREGSGIEQAAFDAIANDAKANCPVSRVLKANITLSSKLSA
jgi:organic hydroperoxide reductase OsmC/OhrA